VTPQFHPELKALRQNFPLPLLPFLTAGSLFFPPTRVYAVFRSHRSINNPEPFSGVGQLALCLRREVSFRFGEANLFSFNFSFLFPCLSYYLRSRYLFETTTLSLNARVLPPLRRSPPNVTLVTVLYVSSGRFPIIFFRVNKLPFYRLNPCFQTSSMPIPNPACLPFSYANVLFHHIVR